MARKINELSIFGINLLQSHGDRGLNSVRETTAFNVSSLRETVG